MQFHRKLFLHATSAVILCAAALMAASFFGRSMGQTQAFARAAAQFNSRVFIPVVMKGDVQEKSSSGNWLAYLNSYRSMAELPPLSENNGWSLGSHHHARYTVKNDVLEHGEDNSNPWYTPEGHAAAQSGNIMASGNLEAGDDYAVEAWMQAPFHAVAILDPALKQVGFGSYREADGGLQMGATLDVLRGLGPVPAGVQYPVAWPADGTSVPLNLYWGEYPDPLSSCPGYAAPSGLPVILQVGPGDRIPEINSHSFKRGSQSLESCIFSESTYVNPDAMAQDLGRAVLAERDAVVLIPREPLTPGATYSVSITVDGQNYRWQFSVVGEN